MILRMDRQAGPGEGPERPALRLPPASFPVIFRRIQDPHAPWHVRAISALLAMVITLAGVVLILLIAALVKSVYDRLDAIDAARAADRARQKAAHEVAPPRGDGAVPLILSKEPPPAAPSAQAPAPPPSGPSAAPSTRPGESR